ncbi:hypothetical protein JOB18_027733 [Solea senegalensis]|uniref:Uncharacterized protein n=1 Tax=Solea senegalensis TaxID=28829 RepID=A0AAV6S4G3_SOLSE|nr:hypothetical protein JOB18_027733 [Solea senegalensis]
MDLHILWGRTDGPATPGLERHYALVNDGVLGQSETLWCLQMCEIQSRGDDDDDDDDDDLRLVRKGTSCSHSRDSCACCSILIHRSRLWRDDGNVSRSRSTLSPASILTLLRSIASLPPSQVKSKASVKCKREHPAVRVRPGPCGLKCRAEVMGSSRKEDVSSAPSSSPRSIPVTARLCLFF